MPSYSLTCDTGSVLRRRANSAGGSGPEARLKGKLGASLAEPEVEAEMAMAAGVVLRALLLLSMERVVVVVVVAAAGRRERWRAARATYMVGEVFSRGGALAWVAVMIRGFIYYAGGRVGQDHEVAGCVACAGCLASVVRNIADRWV